ncbi:hypothetical protein ACFVH0_22905 [Streptomyces sp. NPDC127117]
MPGTSWFDRRAVAPAGVRNLGRPLTPGARRASFGGPTAPAGAAAL